MLRSGQLNYVLDEKKETQRSYSEMGRYTNMQLVAMVLIPLYFETAREPMTLGGTPLSTSSNPHPPHQSQGKTKSAVITWHASAQNATFWQPPSP
jgi:hypothetical protein